MRPLFEKVTVPEGASWSLLHRRLEDGIPFYWHYHPEFELTLTLNSRGQRYIGDSIETYDDGDLVLLGPNLPHTWCSAERIDARRPHVALVMWFTEAWAAKRHRGARRDAAGRAAARPFRPRHRLLAGGGSGGAADHRDHTGAQPDRPAPPPDGGPVAPGRRHRLPP